MGPHSNDLISVDVDGHEIATTASFDSYHKSFREPYESCGYAMGETRQIVGWSRAASPFLIGIGIKLTLSMDIGCGTRKTTDNGNLLRSCS